MTQFLKIGDRIVNPEHIVGLRPGYRTEYTKGVSANIPTLRLLLAVSSGGEADGEMITGPEEWIYDRDSQEGRALLGFLTSRAIDILPFKNSVRPPSTDVIADELATALGQQTSRLVALEAACQYGMQRTIYSSTILEVAANTLEELGYCENTPGSLSHTLRLKSAKECEALAQKPSVGEQVAERDNLLYAAAAVVACFQNDLKWWEDAGDHYEGKFTSDQIRAMTLDELRVEVERAGGATW